ncbi:MAG TPA: hypothetical protein VGN26_16400 [Armatimonadota bacterium]|jgi:hypothetical protein
MRIRAFVAVLGLLLVVSGAAQAQLVLSFDAAGMSGQVGQTLTYSGTLTNLGPDPLYLNGASVGGLSADLTVDLDPFLLGAPFLMAQSDTWSGELLRVTLGSGASVGDSVGFLTVLGGAGFSDQDALAVQPFVVTVEPTTPTPELPASMVAWLGALLPLGCLLRRASPSGSATGARRQRD